MCTDIQDQGRKTQAKGRAKSGILCYRVNKSSAAENSATHVSENC